MAWDELKKLIVEGRFVLGADLMVQGGLSHFRYRNNSPFRSLGQMEVVDCTCGELKPGGEYE